MNKHSKHDIEYVSWRISNCSYHGNFEATKQLMELFDTINMPKHRLNNLDDYIDMYDWNFYTYWTWEALVKSEAEQNNGFTEEECKAELGKTIWQLPCGWFVQYV